MGPMTGRAAGFCAGYGVPGFANVAGGGFGCGRGWGAGMGRGMGMGRGFRGAFPVAMAPMPELTRDQQAAALQAQSEALAEQLDAVKQRLAELA
jgi:hypothetical protein